MWVKHIEGVWSYLVIDNSFVVIVQGFIRIEAQIILNLCSQRVH